MKKTTITRSVARTLGIATVALAAGLFLGCSGGEEEEAASPEDTKAAETSEVNESAPPPDADGGSGE